MSEQERCQCNDCGAWLRILDTPAGERPNYRAGKTVEGHTIEECLLNQLAQRDAENERLRTHCNALATRWLKSANKSMVHGFADSAEVYQRCAEQVKLEATPHDH